MKRQCQNCGKFVLPPPEHKPQTRYCSHEGPIEMERVVLEVPGDKPIVKKICGSWLDCGLLDLGITKLAV